MADPKVKVVLTIDGKQYEAGMNRADKKTKKSTAEINHLTTALKVAAVGYVALRIASSFIKNFREQEQSVAALNQSLTSMGRTTEGLSTHLQDLASIIQEEGIIGDEAIIKGQSFLATYSDITDELLPRTTRIMADLAAKMGGDTVQAANLLGKASMGMTGDLARVGITLSDATKKSKDFKAILGEIEEQAGGMNKALGGTATGAIDQMGNAWGDITEQFGKSLAETFEPGIRSLTNLFLDLAKSMDSADAAELKMLKALEAKYSSNDDEDDGTDQESEGDLGTSRIDRIAELEASQAKKENEVTQGRTAFSGSTEDEIAEEEKFSERLERRLQKQMEAYATEEELVDMHYQREIDLNEQSWIRGLATDEHYGNVKNQAEQLRQEELTEIARTGNISRETFGKLTAKNQLDVALSWGQQMLGAFSDTNEDLFNADKNFRLAQIALTGPSAIIQSFSNGGGFPWGLLPASMMALQVKKQWDSASKTSFGGRSAPSASIGGGGGSSPSIPSIPEISAPDTNTEDPIFEPIDKPQVLSIILKGGELHSSETIRDGFMDGIKEAKEAGYSFDEVEIVLQ